MCTLEHYILIILLDIFQQQKEIIIKKEKRKNILTDLYINRKKAFIEDQTIAQNRITSNKYNE